MNKPRARTPWSRRRWVLVIGAVLLAIALVAGVVLWNASRTPAGPTTDVVRATRTDETTTVSLAGVLAPQQQANVSFAVPGTVRTIDVKVGDTVTVDQQLATVGDRDLRNALSLAEAQATAARAQLQTARDADRATSAQVAGARGGVAWGDAAVARGRGPPAPPPAPRPAPAGAAPPPRGRPPSRPTPPWRRPATGWPTRS